MGTRSTTKIYDDGKFLFALYKQYDGYPDSWGKELKAFIQSGKFVNGISDNKKGEIVFNGMGCFALQLVKEFKKRAGDLYATTEDDTQEYNYTIDYVLFRDLDEAIEDEATGSVTIRSRELRLRCLEEPKFDKTWKINV